MLPIQLVTHWGGIGGPGHLYMYTNQKYDEQLGSHVYHLGSLLDIGDPT